MFFDVRAFELHHPYRPSVARGFADLNLLRREIFPAFPMLRSNISAGFVGRAPLCLRYDEVAFQ
jgi:hypothetical protein